MLAGKPGPRYSYRNSSYDRNSDEKKKKKAGNIPSLFIFLLVGAAAWFFFLQEPKESQTASNAYSQEEASNSASSEEPALFNPKDGYILQFQDSYNPGLNSLDDLGISVLIAVDVSGSMADPPASGDQNPKYIQASKALNQILDFLEKLMGTPSMQGMTLKLGILGFYSELEEIAPLTLMDAQGFEKIRTLTANPEYFEPGGRTAIGLALERGAEILSQSGTIMKSLLVITDGENTSGPAPEDVLWAINENRNNKSTRDFPVLTRGILSSVIGFDVNTSIFTALENEGMRISSAADQEELRAALESSLAADITKLEAAEN